MYCCNISKQFSKLNALDRDHRHLYTLNSSGELEKKFIIPLLFSKVMGLFKCYRERAYVDLERKLFLFHERKLKDLKTFLPETQRIVSGIASRHFPQFNTGSASPCNTSAKGGSVQNGLNERINGSTNERVQVKGQEIDPIETILGFFSLIGVNEEYFHHEGILNRKRVQEVFERHDLFTTEILHPLCCHFVAGHPEESNFVTLRETVRSDQRWLNAGLRLQFKYDRFYKFFNSITIQSTREEVKQALTQILELVNLEEDLNPILERFEWIKNLRETFFPKSTGDTPPLGKTASKV